ncbi:MAG: porin family protein [Tangfeifania sp.]
MLKKIIIPFLFLMVVQVVSAQRFQGGILAGLNASQVEGTLINGVNINGYHKPGILTGFFVQTDFAPAIFGGMEIKYSQKGVRKKIDEKNPDPQKYVMRLGYVDVPFYAGFRTSDRSSVIAGVSAGYLMHAKEIDNYGEIPQEEKNEFNNIDLQPFFGFEFDMLDQVKLDLRFALSVLPIREQSGENPTSYYWHNNQFNNVISLAGYYYLGR